MSEPIKQGTKGAQTKATAQPAAEGPPAQAVAQAQPQGKPDAAGDDLAAMVAKITDERDALASELVEARRALEDVEQRTREMASDIERKSKRLDEAMEAIKVAVPRMEYLIDDGDTREEALKEIDKQVAKAVAYRVEVHGAAPEPTSEPTKAELGPYRVTEAKQVAYGGGITVIPAGTLVDIRGYGLNGIARLREQGVKMELLPE